MDLNEVQKLEKVFENYRGIILQFIELKKSAMEGMNQKKVKGIDKLMEKKKKVEDKLTI